MSEKMVAEWAEERQERTEQSTLVRAATRAASLRFYAVHECVSPPTKSS